MTDPHPTLLEHVPGFRLRSGRTLAATVAYVTLGALNRKRSNAILIGHGFSTSHRFILDDEFAAETSWKHLVGPGRAIDTDRYFVICSNALGSCYGSTGPASVDPASGERWGSRFPSITLADMVSLQRSLLDALGIARLHAVVGVSMGGYQALQWGVQYPEAMNKLVVALSAPSSSPGTMAALRETLAATPGWNAGNPAPQGMVDALTGMRIKTLQAYGLRDWLDDQQLSPEQRDRTIERLARGWAETFDPLSLLVLREAIDRFDVRPELGQVRARLLLVLSTTDSIFPAASGPALIEQLVNHGVRARFHPIDSRYGHLASGLDWNRWDSQLAKFLAEAE